MMMIHFIKKNRLSLLISLIVTMPTILAVRFDNELCVMSNSDKVKTSFLLIAVFALTNMVVYFARGLSHAFKEENNDKQ